MSPKALPIVVAVLLQTTPLPADVFGTDQNQFEMEFVAIAGGTVADDPLPQNSIRYGAVAYDYRMGKHEVSRAMIEAYNAQSGGPTITLLDMTSFGGNGPDRPALGISWNEAARFVNWLNTSSGYSPAYKFTTGGANDPITLWTAGDAGYDPANPYRNTNAHYFIPSEDEWHRAALYDPVVEDYWTYPTGTDLPDTPASVTNGTAPNTAVYGLPVATGPADITDAGGLSPFGTMAQGGNAIEWVESAEVAPNDTAVEDRVIRGGGWYLSEFWLRATRQGEPVDLTGNLIGFRVASVSVSVPVLKIRNPRRLESAFVADIESNVGNVDVYRSQDLSDWGSAPILADVPPGSAIVIDPAPPAGRAFYILTAAGSPPP